MINNILIIGITGNGKSALANTLSSNSVDNKFGEGNAVVSQTKDYQQSDIFEWQGKKYRLIDNIGFSDTNNISEEEVLLKIGEGIYSAQEGINQVLFVFGGRFGPEHVEAFNKFKKFIAESKITKFTTLVRTNFPNFRNSESCEEDRNTLLTQNRELVGIINSCNGIIYVDNPSVSATNPRRAKLNIKKREDSRKIVMDYLAETCLETYKFGEWNNIYETVESYINKKREIEENNDESTIKEEKLSKLRNETTKKIKSHLVNELSVTFKVTSAIEIIKN